MNRQNDPLSDDSFPRPDIWLDHRVSYGETDAMGVVYYAEYLHLFERARSEFIRSLGCSYAEVEEKGVFLPVREASCRYRKPMRYDQLIRIRTGIEVWGRASMRFVYEILSEDRTVLHATGMTEHACVNREGRPVPAPAWLRDMLSRPTG